LFVAATGALLFAAAAGVAPESVVVDVVEVFRLSDTVIALASSVFFAVDFPSVKNECLFCLKRFPQRMMHGK
jgi:hypothetical protein